MTTYDYLSSLYKAMNGWVHNDLIEDERFLNLIIADTSRKHAGTEHKNRVSDEKYLDIRNDLYNDLNILDNKTSSILSFNAILFAAGLFAIETKDHSDFFIDLITYISMILSGAAVIWAHGVVALRWGMLTRGNLQEAEDPGSIRYNDLLKLVKVRRKRTVIYRRAWSFSLLSIFYLCVAVTLEMIPKQLDFSQGPCDHGPHPNYLFEFLEHLNILTGTTAVTAIILTLFTFEIINTLESKPKATEPEPITKEPSHAPGTNPTYSQGGKIRSPEKSEPLQTSTTSIKSASMKQTDAPEVTRTEGNPQTLWLAIALSLFTILYRRYHDSASHVESDKDIGHNFQ